MNIRIFLITLILFFVIFDKLPAQKLPDSRKSSYYTYIFKLTDKEAKKLYHSNLNNIDLSFFHTKIDSFPTDSIFTHKLLQGHFIKAYAEEDKINVSVTTISDFNIYLFNNQTDLCIQVTDLEGKIIDDANVKVRWKTLHFNKELKCYIDRKSNQRGILEVSVNGFTTYHNLSREFNNPLILRETKIILYSKPMVYIWKPVKFVIKLPIDGVKSIVNGWATGTIWRTRHFFVNVWNKIGCLFDEYYCYEAYHNNFSNKYNGFLVFNQPIYNQGDTVKLKAFISTNKGKPLNKEVKISVGSLSGTDNIYLEKIKPYRPGFYKYQFILHDSLKLQIDQRADVSLFKKDYKSYINGSFKYEEYELSNKTLTIRTNSDEQFKDREYKLFINGTDENGLNLKDARVEVSLLPLKTNSIEFCDKAVFIADTIITLKRKLLPDSETEIIIPDSVFPKANFKYDLQVKMITSDNDFQTQSKEIKFYYLSEKFKIELIEDSIAFEYISNGIRKSSYTTIVAKDNFNNQTELFSGFTPFKLKINPVYSSYTAKSENIEETFTLNNEDSKIECYTERTSDSMWILLSNPYRIPVSYSIYKRNHLLAEGISDSIYIARRILSKKNCYISLNYIWGGNANKQFVRIPLADKKLNIIVTEPKLVYPGQKTKLELQISDYKGHPIKNADVTAYSYTQKFNAGNPSVPYFGNLRKHKRLINEFTLSNIEKKSQVIHNLDYSLWCRIAGIDSIEYFKFLYPGNKIFTFEFPSKDSITQFAPYMVSDGKIRRIQIIYIDNQPVYFSWSNNAQPYSFRVDPGFHSILLRASDAEYTIDSMFFTNGNKLIFCFDTDSLTSRIKVKKRKTELSDNERINLYKYIFPFSDNYNGYPSFLEQNGKVILLNTENSSSRAIRYAGPVSGYYTFNKVDDFTTTFNYEPFFLYEFTPGLLKMRSIDLKSYPTELYDFGGITGLKEQVITKEEIFQQWEQSRESRKQLTARYDFPFSTKKGAGRLMLNMKPGLNGKYENPLQILFFRYDDARFLRIYPGNISLFHDLQKGTYKIAFFFSGGRYFTVDSVQILPNGLNFVELKQPENYTADSYSNILANIIDTTIFNSKSFVNLPIQNNYYNNPHFDYSGLFGSHVKGKVTDSQTGEPVPFANINIVGTNYGCSSDIDGNFSLTFPPGYNAIICTFIGYKKLTINNISTDWLNIRLESTITSLEAVNICYSAPAEYLIGRDNTVSSIAGGVFDFDGEISSIRGGRSMGNYTYIDGIKVLGLTSLPESALEEQAVITGGIPANYGDPGNSSIFSIRGVSSSSSGAMPLIIIDGKIFTGNISKIDPSLIESIDILNDTNAIKIYGNVASKGAIVIHSKSGSYLPCPNNEASFDDRFMTDAGKSTSIRKNFSDYAFWQPDLTTDKNGKVSFEVTFPDDVTSWKTNYIAMTDKRQSGQTSGLIKSYKPLLCQLAVPRFLIQGDDANIIGKTLNYTPDSIPLTTEIVVNEQFLAQKIRFCKNSLIDTIAIHALSDSISIKYTLQTKDNYFDGEQRTIDIFPKGMEDTHGGFYALNNDTIIKLHLDSLKGPIHLYAKTDLLGVIEYDAEELITYKYSCNEQLASRLKALTALKQISLLTGKPFRNEKEAEKIIRNLITNRNEKTGLWGWWKESDDNLWISLYVLEAIDAAKKIGFKADLDSRTLSENLLWLLNNTTNYYDKIRILDMLVHLKINLNYDALIKDLEKTADTSLNSLLQLIELKQDCNIYCNTDTLNYYKKTTLFGNIYYSENDGSPYLLLNNDLLNTTLAYNAFKNDTLAKKESLSLILNYFLEQRQNGNWGNTYQTAKIIETILPDILNKESIKGSTQIEISGDVNKTTGIFPFEMTFDTGVNINIKKSGASPVYFTWYNRYLNETPVKKSGDFEIYTHFDNNNDSLLQAGKAVNLIVNLIVKKNAQYVMLNIPIPAGCSYSEKPQIRGIESHREYFKNETSIFCESLPAGNYTFSIKLNPRFTGIYSLNPARVELMYFPVFNANNELRKVVIE